MEQRLVPINAILAILGHRGTSWPHPLLDAGYRLAGIEVPCNAGAQRVVADIVVFNDSTNQFLAIESKSGANIDEDQARRYLAVQAHDLVQQTSVTIRSDSPFKVHIVYACLASNLNRIRMGLGAVGQSFTRMAVGPTALNFEHDVSVDEQLVAQLPSHVPIASPPPAIIRVDGDSSDKAFDRLVVPRLIAALARSEQVIRTPALSDACIPYLPQTAQGQRNRLERRVEASARRVCDRAPEHFEFMRRTQSRDFSTIQFLYPTEDGDRRGRTAKYQALQRLLVNDQETVTLEPRQGSLFEEGQLDTEMDSIDRGLSGAGSDILAAEE